MELLLRYVEEGNLSAAQRIVLVMRSFDAASTEGQDAIATLARILAAKSNRQPAACHYLTQVPPKRQCGERENEP